MTEVKGFRATQQDRQQHISSALTNLLSICFVLLSYLNNEALLIDCKGNRLLKQKTLG